MFDYHQRPLDKNGWDRWDNIKWEKESGDEEKYSSEEEKDSSSKKETRKE